MKSSSSKPLAFSALLTLLLALWGGLLRLQWHLPVPQAHWVSFHGPLMVSGFFGAIISLARANALKYKLGFRSDLVFVVPLAVVLGAWTFLLGGPEKLGESFFLASSLGYLALSAVYFRVQSFPFAALAWAGGAGWAWGNWMWLQGSPISQVVTGWMGLLILTIVSERLEAAGWSLKGAKDWIPLIGSVLLVLGMAAEPFGPAFGIRLFSAGNLLLALSLFALDAVKATAREAGWRIYLKTCLYSGYAWLLVSAVVGWMETPVDSGFAYDAFLHAVFLGMVFSMVFSHAPLLLPRVLKRSISFHPFFYSHWILLQLSVLTRVLGDAMGSTPWRRWGGLLNAFALLLFMGNTLWAVRRAQWMGQREPFPAPSSILPRGS